MTFSVGRHGFGSSDQPDVDMQVDEIEAIGIDEGGGLWVKPATKKFPYIYREAMEVGWDARRLCLTSPRPRDWSNMQWFEQMLRAARQQGAVLTLAANTSWVNVDEKLKQAIIERGNLILNRSTLCHNVSVYSHATVTKLTS